MLGIDCFRSKRLVIVLEAVVDKASVDRFGQAALWRLLKTYALFSS